MSAVDNVLMSWQILEDERVLIQSINAWTREHARGQEFVEMSERYDVYGGHKVMETKLLAAAFNHFPEAAFLAFVRTLPWEDPECVQYIVKRSESDVFEVIYPCEDADRSTAR